MSWRTLLPELESAWRATAQRKAIALDPPGNSFRLWAERLHAEARSAARTAELSHWQRIISRPDTPLGPRSLDARDTVATLAQLQLQLHTGATQAVLSEVPALFHARINDVLLGALVLAMNAWRRRRGIGGGAGMRVDVEGHGRESLFEGLDWSQTVGWFTSEFPLWLDPGSLDLDEAMDGRAAAGQLLKRIKEQLREVPDHGIGFGLLRHLNDSTAAQLEGHRPAQVGFNYMGRFQAATGADWSPAAELDGMAAPLDTTLPLHHSIVLDAFVRDRPDGPQLEANWSWAGHLFDQDAIGQLGRYWFEALEAFIAYARKPGAGGFTPSDISLVELNQSEIENLEAEFSLQSMSLGSDEPSEA